MKKTILRKGLVISLDQEKLYNLMYSEYKRLYISNITISNNVQVHSCENGKIYHRIHRNYNTGEHIEDCFDFYIYSKKFRVYHNDTFKITSIKHNKIIIESLYSSINLNMSLEFTLKEFKELPFICVGKCKV